MAKKRKDNTPKRNGRIGVGTGNVPKTRITFGSDGIDGFSFSNAAGKTSKLIDRVLERVIYSKPGKKELIEFLFALYSMYSPTGKEEDVVNYCRECFTQYGFKVFVGKENNLYATRNLHNTGEKLVCINAHTDTVQNPRDSVVDQYVRYQWYNDVFTGNGYMIGGDDKNGIAVALTLAACTELPMKVILTTGEEKGGIGSAELVASDFKDVAFCFTLDRKGGNDIVSEYCGRTCAPKEFVKTFIDISMRDCNHKFVDVQGSYADTYTISEFVPCINVSAGYYNAHTANDFTDVGELYDVMMCIANAIVNRDELIHSIENSPTDWFKDIHEGDPNYKRGKYVGSPVTYYRPSGSGWDYYGMGGYWDREYGASNRAGSEPTKKVSSGKNADIKARGTACHVQYDKVRGRDDKTDVNVSVSEHKPLIMTVEEGAHFAAYNDHKITDDQWDSLLLNGQISAMLHRVGVEKRVSERNAFIKAFVAENCPQAAYRANSAMATKRAYEEPKYPEPPAAHVVEVPSFDDNGYYNDAKDLSLLAHNVANSLNEDTASETSLWVTETDADLEDEQYLEELANRCGFLAGSTEYSIFMDYVAGIASTEELKEYCDTGFIDTRTFDQAIAARKEFEVRRIQRKSVHTFKEEEREKHEYEREKKKTKKSPKSHETAVDGFRKMSELNPYEIGLIVNYARRGKMEGAENVYDDVVYYADVERRYYNKHGRLSLDLKAAVADAIRIGQSGNMVPEDTEQSDNDDVRDRDLDNLTPREIILIKWYIEGGIPDAQWNTDPNGNFQLKKDVVRIGLRERSHYARYGVTSRELYHALMCNGYSDVEGTVDK